jgi:SRSO17 transposase
LFAKSRKCHAKAGVDAEREVCKIRLRCGACSFARSGARFDAHQKLLYLVAESPWSDEKLLAKVREQVVPEMTRRGTIEVWIIDDTAFPKKGTHSVGVDHQYCGQLGKQVNCQVAVTLSIANHHASLPSQIP